VSPTSRVTSTIYQRCNQESQIEGQAKQWPKEKGLTDNDLQNTAQNTKDWASLTPPKKKKKSGGGENNWPAASHWQTSSHNVVSSTPRHEWDSNSQL
jgi:hypothetical protein